MNIFAKWRLHRQNRKAARLFHRGLFVYRYNSKLIVFDPVVIYKSLRAVGYENVGKAMKGALDEKNPGGLDKFFKVMHDAFGVDPINETGKGMTVREMVDMLQNYFEWLNSVKKNITLTQESEPSTGSNQLSNTADSQERQADEPKSDTANS